MRADYRGFHFLIRKKNAAVKLCLCETDVSIKFSYKDLLMR